MTFYAEILYYASKYDIWNTPGGPAKPAMILAWLVLCCEMPLEISRQRERDFISQKLKEWLFTQMLQKTVILACRKTSFGGQLIIVNINSRKYMDA